ncbi:MAG: DnaD domain protein [Clostridia bacterium]|nr:DnaD domain protein [Clostridia bacterium]
MSFCSYAEGDAMRGTTAIANMFIMEYLPSAPADYVKVYLFGLLLCRHPEVCESMEKLGEVLHLDDNTVKNAFSYWEREGAVIRQSDNPPTYSFITLAPGNDGSDKTDDGVYENRDYIKTLQSMMPSLILENHELRIANDWLDTLRLDKDTVYLMVRTEVEKRGNRLPAAKTMFKHLDEVAIKWAEAGATNVEKAREYLARNSATANTARSVIKRFNQKREPTVDEIEMARVWLEDWKYTEEQILAACEETTKGERPSFAYLNSVLEGKRNNPDSELFEKVKKLNTHLIISTRPSPSQIESLKAFLQMGFEFEAIEQAAVQCGEHNRNRYEDIAKKLTQWQKAGTYTVADIEEERKQRKYFSDIMTKVFENAGIDSRVTDADLKTIRLWTALIDKDAVLLAAESAHGTDNPIKYIDKIIKTWSASGINTLEKAKAAVQKGAPQKKNPNKILNERTVTEDEFSDGFYADIMNGEGLDSK